VDSSSAFAAASTCTLSIGVPSLPAFHRQRSLIVLKEEATSRLRSDGASTSSGYNSRRCAITGPEVAGWIDEGLDQEDRVTPGSYPVPAQPFQGPRHHRGCRVLTSTCRQHAEPLVRRDEPQPAQLVLGRPPDEAVTGPARQCRRREPEQCDPLARRIHCCVTHDLADHPVTEPVVFIELCVESRSFTELDRSDGQTFEPRVSHPSDGAPPPWITPIRIRRPRSEARAYDFEEAMAECPLPFREGALSDPQDLLEVILPLSGVQCSFHSEVTEQRLTGSGSWPAGREPTCYQPPAQPERWSRR
jgi:hypothetical protein